ncbi:tryptophan 7-halogenase [Sphingomonas sp. SUN019]|uniref:tryptophan halogenase family protein n=1 Tax=Sphingomonas sp. SUN019 TaxID=2937788 RepID=UPI002164E984|nr:tryptophan halogenase family protein [Sphingomonas sp. SUN019]UVO51870.1 tryptophan 7-halogenase [Sphingomonas sp. SUN019]
MTPSIVILGGGTAGWMAACLMAKAWPASTITVIESPDIGIVGVGEGSTPQLRAFFRTLGIAEADWMPAANATYKVGIEFRGWSDASGYDRYFHPFASDVDVHTEGAFHAAHHARRTGHDVPAHPDRFFLNTRLAREGLGPIAAETFPFDAAYGYHFDAHLVGAVLREHAIGRGVRHLPRTVVHTSVDESGNIRKLSLGDEEVSADIFVDCSGFRSVLAQQALGVPFVNFGENLFNDRAVVMPTSAEAATKPYTTATAMKNGWVWDIPLTSRTGNGYVYSSRYCDPDGAEAELRAHLGVGDDGTARHLEMKVGRVADTWRGNCLAVGLAQGFIEPLEATALHIVQATVEGFIESYEDGGFTPEHRSTFNATIARRYEGIRDYIVAHYRMNQRTDTPYWCDNAAHDRLSDSLKSLMTAWFTGRDLTAEIAHQDIARYYAPLSWGCLFAGYGTFPNAARLRPADVSSDGIDDFLRRCALNFTPHDALLATKESA